MDQRLEKRRRQVAEERARSNLGRLIRLLVLVSVVAAAVWFAQSPYLSVQDVEVAGAEEVDVAAILARHGVVVGRPMVLLDISAARQALLREPWVSDARVARDWPTRVLVEVAEHTAAAAVRFAGGWWLASADGTFLEEVGTPPSDLGQAHFPGLTRAEAGEDLDVLGAIEFLAALPGSYRPVTSLARGPEGLEATMGDFPVRLGRPFDMGEKASVAVAMIEAGVEEGSILTVVAPASPAVLPPGQQAPTDTTAGPEP